MATITIGQAAYVNRGAYNANTAYAALNTVFFDGGTWVALQNVTGVTPGTDSTKWLCITQGIKTLSVAAGSTGYVNVTITLTDGTSSSTSVPVGGIGNKSITTSMLADDCVTDAQTDFSAGLHVGKLILDSSSYGTSLPASGVQGQLFFKKV